MSLFRTREWWSAPSDSEDEYANGCLCLANIDNAPDGDDKIITGGFSGVLRIWRPRSGKSESHVEDLLLEELTGFPILQLAAGRFAPGVVGLALAVLHPHKLSVYSITADYDQSGSQALFYRLNKLYEHVFAASFANSTSTSGGKSVSFTACNMTHGTFGAAGSAPTSPGSYGAAALKDFVCVQSMDGQLAFFEQERPLFRRQLESILLPGPITYLSRTDSIIVVNSEMAVESYKYQVLSGAWSSEGPKRGGAVEGKEEDTVGVSGGRKLRNEWSVNIGEHAHALLLGKLSSNLSSGAGDIVVVGERTLLTLKENPTLYFPGLDTSAPASAATVLAAATASMAAASSSAAGSPTAGSEAMPTLSSIRMQKRLDYYPAAACVYSKLPAGDNHHGLLIATHTCQLMVYSGETLAWAAQMPFVPVAVAVGKFSGVPGLVAALSVRGDVCISYLGTDPPTGSITGGETVKELDYEAMDAEHRRLLLTIREAQSEHRAEPIDKIVLWVQVPPTIDDTTSSRFQDGRFATVDADDDVYNDYGPLGGDGASSTSNVKPPKITVKLNVSYQGATALSSVHIVVAPPLWALLPDSQRSIVIPELKGTGPRGAATPLAIPLTFRCSRHAIPWDTLVRITATYATENGETRNANTEFQLPLYIAAGVIPPVKTALFKFTIDTNRAPPPLTALFSDMLRQPSKALSQETMARITANANNVMSFAYYSGGDVTVLVSKAGGRYRLQAGSLEALYLVASQLCERLTRHFTADVPPTTGEPPFAITYNEPLPLADFFACIDQHFNTRRELAKAYSQLNDRAHEYRLVTKRLLVRFKDRTPAPLNNLDTLMESAHTNVIAVGDAVAKLQGLLVGLGNKLSCAVSLVQLLMRYRFGIDAAGYDILCHHLPAMVVDSMDQGWEESADAVITQLLRTMANPAAAIESSKHDEAATVVMGVGQAISMPDDTSKLKKHITILCDRLQKGAKLPVGASVPPA